MMRDDIPVPSRTNQFTLKRMYFWLKVGYMVIFLVILGGPLLCMHQQAAESIVHKTFANTSRMSFGAPARLGVRAGAMAYSTNFAVLKFYELRLNGVLGSSHRVGPMLIKPLGRIRAPHGQ